MKWKNQWVTRETTGTPQVCNTSYSSKHAQWLVIRDIFFKLLCFCTTDIMTRSHGAFCLQKMPTLYRTFLLLSLNVIFLATSCDGGNILVFPVDGSHWINMKVLLEELHLHGHSLTVIRASTSWYIPEHSPLYTSVTLEVDEPLEDFFNIFLQQQMKVTNKLMISLPTIKILCFIKCICFVFINCPMQ